MIAGILSLVIVLGVVVGLIALVVSGARRRPTVDAHSVRRFFQYAVLFGLVIVVAIGAAELLGRAFGTRFEDWEDPTAQLARGLAFTIVGGALLALLAWWTRRMHRADPAETESPLWAAYLTLAALAGAVTASVSVSSIGYALFSASPLDGDDAGTFLAWTGVWAVHWWLARRTLDRSHQTLHLLAGSLVGLVLAVGGLTTTLGTALDLILMPDTIGRSLGLLGESGAVLLVGALLWARYWATDAIHLPRRPLWLGYVLPIGVGGGLVMSLVAGSRLLWSVLVWFVGNRQGDSATVHFASAATEFAALLVGVVVWWYHRTVLGDEEQRSEPQRVYEYLVSGIALVAAAIGVGTVLVSVIEAATPGIDAGMPVENTLLAAVTLLLVGIPVWWVFWARIRRAMATSPSTEVVSPTRRVYLVVLFGLAGVAAVVALITVAVTLMQDVVAGTVGVATLRGMRYGLGTLIGAAAVSAYHGAVFRADRAMGVAGRARGPRSVLLVGAVSPELDRDLTRATGARVEVWGRLDAPAEAWDVAALAEELAGYPGLDVVVVAEGGGHRVLVVDPTGRSAASVVVDLPG